MMHQNNISLKKSYRFADDRGFGMLISLMIVFMMIISVSSLEAAGQTHTEQITPSKKIIKESKKNPINIEMYYNDERLTARIISAPLNQVLKELSHLTGLKVLYQYKFSEKLVSENFTALTLDDAVQKILQGESFLLTYETSEESRKLSQVLILSHYGEGEITDVNVRPNPKAESFALIDVQEARDEDLCNLKAHNIEEDPSDIRQDEMEEKHNKIISRLERLDSLMQKGNEQETQEFLHEMIIDPESEIRMIALAELTDLDTLPVDTLIDIVRNDPEPHLKRQAADYLSMHANKDPKVKRMLAELDIEDHIPLNDLPDNIQPDELNEFSD